MIDQTDSATETSIACILNGEELAERGNDVTALFAAVEEVRELTDGHAFRFPGGDETASRLLDFILAERRCCPFFTFDLVFEPNRGAIWVHLRGSTAVKEFVASSWGEIIAAHA